MSPAPTKIINTGFDPVLLILQQDPKAVNKIDLAPVNKIQIFFDSRNEALDNSKHGFDKWVGEY
jgi:hypothetical protein